jgi:hypothetical protein
MGILRSDHSLCISIGDLSNLDVLIAGWGLPATSLKDATLESAQLSFTAAGGPGKPGVPGQGGAPGGRPGKPVLLVSLAWDIKAACY